VPVRPDYIQKALDTLYKYTDMRNNRVIVVDQTMDGLNLSRDQVHLVLRPHRNLGFSKANNEGIIHALRWGSKYITCANDDIEFMDSRWWDGIEETFLIYGDKVMAVNPMSPLEPGWGYGLEHGINIELLPYKDFTKEDYDYLLKGDFSALDDKLPKTFPRQKSGCIDAIATWCTVFKTESFEKVGLFDEKFYPGGGEDYDLNARAYRQGLRFLGTTKSWVWHFWGSSKDKQSSTQMKDLGMPIVDKLRWNDGNSLWPPEKNLSWNPETKKMEPKKFDPWGRVTLEDGTKKPMIRIPEVGIVEI